MDGRDLLACLISLILGGLGGAGIVTPSVERSVNNRWRQECVDRGVAEYVNIDQYGHTEWRWIDPKKSDN